MSVLPRPPSDSLHWSWVLSLASVSVCFWNLLQRASVELAELLPDPAHTHAHKHTAGSGWDPSTLQTNLRSLNPSFADG